MKSINIKLSVATVALCCSVSAMAQSDRLHYDKPAYYFEEALPIGNGTQGAMVYGGVREDKLSLNDITLWTGEPQKDVFSPDAYKAIPDIRKALFSEDYETANKLHMQVQGQYSQNYQPLGTLTVRTESTCYAHSAYSRGLDISQAVATVTLKGEERSYFASAPDSVIVMHIRSINGKPFTKRFTYDCKLPSLRKANKNEMTIDGFAAYMTKPGYTGIENSFLYDSNRGVHFRTIIRVVNKDGEVRVINEEDLLLTDCTEATIIIANVTSFNGADKDPVKEGRDYKTLVRQRIDHAAETAYSEMLKRHVADYQEYYNRVQIDLGTTAAEIAAKPTNQQLLDFTDKNEKNPDLEELYFNYGRYLLISCSRTEGVPANLQGLWNEKILPPWSCNYTSNINVEENYWPSEQAGLGDMHQSLIGFIKQLPKGGAQTAKSYYGVQDGWCLAHNTDIWALTNPVGEREGDPCWANWNMGGAWISTHLWEHYAFTMDKAYLREVYPVLKGAADFCLGWLTTNPSFSTKWLLTAPSTSPENVFLTDKGYAGATLYGGFADLAMVRECLIDTRDAAIALGEDKAYIKRLNDTLARLLPYRIGKKGNLQEWFHDWEDKEPTHRHQSHLFGLYPGHHISFENKSFDLLKACAKSLEIKGDKTTGWSSGWRVNLFARLHEGEKAYHIYRMLLNYITPDDYRGADRRKGGGTYPNMLDAHSPFQIDGNFGGTAGVMEMLVQSTLTEKGAIATLLPALPDNWKASGSLKGVRIRGGYALDFSWRDGRVTSVKVHSLAPAGTKKVPLTLCYNGMKKKY